MKLRSLPSLLILLLLSIVAGRFIAPTRPPAPPTPIPAPELAIPSRTAETSKPPASKYQFEFATPFDPRAELDRAKASSDRNERLGRFIAIGYRSAQQTPLANLPKLSPEFWEYRNYDLRGAFHAEWLRLDPQAYLQWAEPTYQRLEKENQLRLFPSYHLAYLEPISTLELLPMVKTEGLQAELKTNLLSTLVEFDPETLWARKSEIASESAIIKSAQSKGLFDLVLDFWARSNWIEIPFDEDFLHFLATRKRTDLASHLASQDKAPFLAQLALVAPQTAANWTGAQSIHPKPYNSNFSTEHAPFFRQLVRHPKFSSWETAPKWLRLITTIDPQGELAPTLFHAIRAHPELSYSTSLQYSFRDYMQNIEDPKQIESFYLSLDNTHPILSSLETFMMRSETDFSRALIARATKESPTPDRLFKTLAFGDTESWPDTYFAAARDTLNSLSDEDLMWSLTPNSILSALELAPDRIKNLLEQSDPQWLLNTLSSPHFTRGITLENFSQLPEILHDLPAEKQADIIENARFGLLANAYTAEDKLPYLRMTKSAKEAAMVSAQIGLDEYRNNPAIKEEIQTHPHKDSILLGIISESFDVDYQDPELQRAAKLFEKSESLLYGNRNQIVSTIQSLPPEERFSVVKTALLVNVDRHVFPATQKIIDLPIWSDEQKRELQDLNYHNKINYNLQPPPIDFW